MQITEPNLTPAKSQNSFTPVAISMAIITGMFIVIQAFYFRHSPTLPPLKSFDPKRSKS
jgi:hypothetical protein